ncbi:MAG: hypothetical protein Q8O55_06355 [Dehalococcoidales bacterium]|nr:hypothetical protein [Dehalococcoidales bacterium]
MEIEAFRDVVIIVTGLLIILVAILLGVFAYILYLKIDRIMKSVTAMVTKVEALTAIASDDVGKPLIWTAGLIQGIACGIRGIKKAFRKEK